MGPDKKRSRPPEEEQAQRILVEGAERMASKLKHEKEMMKSKKKKKKKKRKLEEGAPKHGVETVEVLDEQVVGGGEKGAAGATGSSASEPSLAKKKKKERKKGNGEREPSTATGAPAPPVLVVQPPRKPRPGVEQLGVSGLLPGSPGFTPEVKLRFPNLTADQWAKLERLGAMIQDWNARVNVISRKDIVNVIPNHIVPCIGAAKLLMPAPIGTKVMDVGCGGGFPGLPFAICCPNIKFLLVDSIGKKVKVVQDIADKLGLSNVSTRHARVESVQDRFHYVTGRSVTAMPRFVDWVRDKLLGADDVKGRPPRPQGLPEEGILYIKGGIDEEHLEDLGGLLPTRRYPISDLIGAGLYTGDKSVIHYATPGLRGK